MFPLQSRVSVSLLRRGVKSSHRPPDHARPRPKIIIYFPGNAFFFVVGRIGEWLTFSSPKLIFPFFLYLAYHLDILSESLSHFGQVDSRQ